jgi:hypothetical protein
MLNYTLAYFWLAPIAASCGTVLVVTAVAGVAGIATAVGKSKEQKSDKQKET